MKDQNLDIDDFRLRVGDDVDLMLEIYGIYLEDSHNLLMNISEAAANDDFEELRKSAHALKGASASISAKRVWELAEDMEKACVEQKAGSIESLLCSLKETHETTNISIRKILDEPELLHTFKKSED